MSAKHLVLYADDDTDDIQLVKDALVNYSDKIELVTVSDGLEALSFLKNIPQNHPRPCLIILDINMPRMNGKEALVKLRELERFEDCPAILFTTSNQPVDAAFAKKYNAGFLTKPIDFEQLDIVASTFIDHCSEEIQKSMRQFN